MKTKVNGGRIGLLGDRVLEKNQVFSLSRPVSMMPARATSKMVIPPAR